MKACNQCHEAKPLDRFYKHTRNADGLRRQCKDCFNLNTRIRRKKERIDLAEFRAWRKAQKRAALQEQFNSNPQG